MTSPHILGRLKNGLFALVFMTAACTSAPPASVVPDLSFDNIPAVNVNAGQVQVVDKYRSPMVLPNVEYLFRQSPEEAAHQLVTEKVLPAGLPDRILKVYIDDASVTAKMLTPDDGLMSLFHSEPGVTYHARVALRFELADRAAPDIIIGHASVVAERDLTMDHAVSPNERNMAFFEMEEKLMKDLGDSLQTIVKGTFGKT
ncbi:MAG: hypothetical protein GC185_09500 [Alphaproteobacteria bacterium]|nr:hypothetical protein [Alphaproteobacteria bacterium]